MKQFTDILPCTCFLFYVLVGIVFPSLCYAKPLDLHSADSQVATEDSTLLIVLLAGSVIITTALAVCVCCKKSKGFAEFRSSTQLNDFAQAQPVGEVTLFPPPSLSLSREDLDVSFEPLPKPQTNGSNRSNEILQWIENGHGLFPRSNIQYLREIGRGYFGQVVEADVKDLLPAQLSTRCVVKILRPEATPAQHTQFLNEIEPLLNLNHPNVLKLYGCCLETSPLLMLIQHCANGDLKQFLVAYSPTRATHGLPPLPENVLLRMAWEAAEGLWHWQQCGGRYHEDVAARSFMVTGDMSIVIGDYGTHSFAYKEDFVQVGDKNLPVRWTAPEMIQPSNTSLCSKAGNVWSFGVVLWEILSLGCRPYVTLGDDEVVQQVLQEKRTILNPPTLNYQKGQTLYQLMLDCWEIDPQLRPSMKEVVARLASACAGVSRDVDHELEKAFDSRWDAAGRKSMLATHEEESTESLSASLNNLHGSLDNLELELSGRKDVVSANDTKSESGFSAKVSAALRSLDEALAAAEGTDEDDMLPEPLFRLGGNDPTDPANPDDSNSDSDSISSNNSLFSSRSWQDKVTNGELAALVHDKSRSVQDLMVLTHIEPTSDIEFMSMLGQKDRDSISAIAAPHISVTSPSPSSSVQSPLRQSESNVPLLDSTDAYNHCEKGELDVDSYLNDNRNRLTSTPREDSWTPHDAMESSFRTQHQPNSEDYAPFSPESLDATKFSRKDDEVPPSEAANLSSSVILGPSEELGLDVYQGITTTQNDEDDSCPHPPAAEKSSSTKEPDHVHLDVNVNAWTQFLEQAYPIHQEKTEEEEEEEEEETSDGRIEDVVEDGSTDNGHLKDSGIARPSFSGSVDILGSSFGNESGNREWMDDLSMVARMWNQELAAALALDSRLNSSALSDSDPHVEEAVDITPSSDPSPSKSGGPEETYFSYDKIDEDIRTSQAASKKDLSTIREERESVSSMETAVTPLGETGQSLLSQLQLKNRMQRHMQLSDSSSDDMDDDDEDEVLVVDLESKRAVMMESQSPRLKAAMASQNYDGIFGSHLPADETPTDIYHAHENEVDDEQLEPGVIEAATNAVSDIGDVESNFAQEMEAIFPVEDHQELDDVDEIEANVDGDTSSESDDANNDDDFEYNEEDDDDDNDNEEDAEEDDEEDDDDDEDEDEDEGVAVSNFVWQACYPAKLNQSSMEVIEEECEDEVLEANGAKPSDPEEFVPSTWRADATPTRPAIRSPERSASPKKNVSFTRPKKNEVYQYPSEVVEDPPKSPRKQWRTLSPQQQDSALAEFTDWEYSADDERAVDAKDVEDIETKPVIVRPSNPLTNNLLYRLSGIETEEDEDNDVSNTSDVSDVAHLPNDGYFDGEWPSQFSLSEFQPNQFFANWDGKGNDNPVANGVEETENSLQR